MNNNAISCPVNYLNGESTIHPHPALSESNLYRPVTRALERKGQAFRIDLFLIRFPNYALETGFNSFKHQEANCPLTF